MILTCPQCTTRFLLSAQILAPDGRRVKCSNCEEIWFQKPDPDELAQAENQLPVEDIPESVKPIPEGSALPTLQDDDAAPPFALLFLCKVRGTLAVAAGLFLLIFAVMFLASQPVLAIWPASTPFYKFLGKDVKIPGAGLVFDRVEARIDFVGGDKEKIGLSGQIINLTGERQLVPVIEASLRNKEGDVLRLGLIEPSQSYLEGESNMVFEGAYELPRSGQATDIYVRFVLGKKPVRPVEVKTVLKAAGNSQSLLADDSALPHGDVESVESPAPVSSPPHSESLPESHRSGH